MPLNGCAYQLPKGRTLLAGESKEEIALKDKGSGVFVDRLVRLARTSLSPKRRGNAVVSLWLTPFMSSCRTGTLQLGSLTTHE